mmetsp:Transcript_30183/g.63132  ORF Transcript_30183/g.63132 Transcript_30183/m.63132 type:complete len:122 (-) Transcript_30183:278-643(-)
MSSLREAAAGTTIILNDRITPRILLPHRDLLARDTQGRASFHMKQPPTITTDRQQPNEADFRNLMHITILYYCNTAKVSFDLYIRCSLDSFNFYSRVLWKYRLSFCLESLLTMGEIQSPRN